MEVTGKQYNALTGLEVRTTIMNEVERALTKAGFDSAATTYPGISWSWSLTLRQFDQERPLADTPERTIKVGSEPNAAEKILQAMGGGSKRFRHDPPGPTEVRRAENLPVPEA